MLPSNLNANLIFALRAHIHKQPNYARLFCILKAEFIRHDAENWALYRRYVQSGQQGHTPQFLANEILIDLEAVDAPHALQKALDMLVSFAVEQGLVASRVSKQPMSLAEKTLDIDTEAICRITFRLVPMPETRWDNGAADTHIFGESERETDTLDPNSINSAIEPDDEDVHRG